MILKADACMAIAGMLKQLIIGMLLDFYVIEAFTGLLLAVSEFFRRKA